MARCLFKSITALSLILSLASCMLKGRPDIDLDDPIMKKMFVCGMGYFDKAKLGIEYKKLISEGKAGIDAAREAGSNLLPSIPENDRKDVYKSYIECLGQQISTTNSTVSVGQKGGITAGKIENVNIIIDKEFLGVREPTGLYQKGEKVGTVKNFIANESAKTFTIAEIEFDKPLRDTSVVWQPYEFQEYVIHIRHIETLVSLMPPGAKGVRGNILGKNK